MASTALHLPVDNDQSQLSFWPDNDELAIAGDSFFDQFVTFDTGEGLPLGGEGLGDPPSPSIFLDSLHNEMANSASDPLSLPPSIPNVETSIATISPSISNIPESSTVDQATINSAELAPSVGDVFLSNGSISDSELLHLEGISLRSSPPRGAVTAPTSPPPAISTLLSPRKQSRLIETGYATIRRMAHRPKPLPVKQRHHQPIDMSGLDSFLTDPRCGPDGFGVSYDEFADPAVPVKQEPMDNYGLRLSPPLVYPNFNEHRPGASDFVSGHIDDPFCDDVSGTPVTIRPARHRGVDTPMATAVTKSDIPYYNQAMASLNTHEVPFCHLQKTHRSTSSAEWPVEGLLTDIKYDENVNMWPPAAYVAGNNGNGNTTSPGWWDGGVVHGELTHRHRNADASEIMIQMPQPRAPQAGILSSNLDEHILATNPAMTTNYHISDTTALSRTHHFQPHQHNSSNSGNSHGGGGSSSHNGTKGHGQTERRPRPRAPSSGARHHGAQTSPRKLRQSTSLGYLREEAHSPSPSPSMARHRGNSQGQAHNHHHHNHQERRHQRSSSLTTRKQRSLSRRPGGSGDTRTVSSSTQGSNGGGGGRAASGAGRGGAGGGDESFFEQKFVNFTPDDKNKLMAGVAPSGSSKTKMRREKEALEKTRMIREVAIKVAGGDVDPDVLKELMGGLPS